MLADPAHCADIRRVRGVGPQTANYLKLLVGIPDVVKVDTHLRRFVADAGITGLADEAIAELLIATAAILQVAPADLDAAIWQAAQWRR